MSKHITCTRSYGTESAPLPVIILTAEQEIHQQNGYGCASNDHDSVAKEEKAEHVVNLAEPHIIHDEIKVDENGAEGKNADYEHGRQGAEVSRRRGNLTRYLIHADRRLDGLRIY